MHPTLSGVVLGLLTPATVAFGRWRRAPEPSSGAAAPVERVEAMLHPWVAFGIMPLFALANAGVTLAGVHLAGAPLAVAGGVVLGLVLGKPVGIVLAAGAAVTLKLCSLPEGVRWPHVVLLGVLGGIGFTMSIFISDLAFQGSALLAAAKLAVLLASALAAVLGVACGALLGARSPISSPA
jgi:NhaA family Na+:H+ antiporter